MSEQNDSVRNDVYNEVRAQCEAAKKCSARLAGASTKEKNAVLTAFARLLRGNSAAILAANAEDVAAAEAGGTKTAFLDRLRLTESRIQSMADGADDVVALPDPTGAGECFTRPNGLRISRIRVPLGVVAVIFEARPNVAADVAALCLKSGNAAVLRGGREAHRSNSAVIALARRALDECGLPQDAVQLLSAADRSSSEALMQMRGLVDVLIPRGGKGLIRAVVENARVPVIETGAGNCHTYVSASASVPMALTICENAKLSRPSVCNACETILVHSAAAPAFLPLLDENFTKARCEIRADERARAFCPHAIPATEEDWATEYDDLIVAVKVVDSTDEAIAHINRYGTGHSEAIITEEYAEAALFRAAVDAAAVYVNASTRFTDGGEFGFGAEIGISTQKLHARGPMGLAALTTEKYWIEGNGQVR